MNALNLGCGNRFHPEWVNIDFVAAVPCVQTHDLLKGIPYPDNVFDVIYHSHVLEHFPKNAAAGFLRECCRVLKPSGIIRVVVPDLERITRGYLEALEKASQGLPLWDENYRWMLLELYDQSVREKSYGELVDYFGRDPIPNWNFIYQRWGVQAQSLLEHLGKQGALSGGRRTSPGSAWGYVARNPITVLRNKLVRILLGEEDWKALQVAKFRKQGEIHLWMYDSYSLGKLLYETGFFNAREFQAGESLIPGWKDFHLDTEPDGTVYKPDSLYMEAQKS
jgi:predicted SAM-dependent methyltransferase